MTTARQERPHAPATLLGITPVMLGVLFASLVGQPALGLLGVLASVAAAWGLSGGRHGGLEALGFIRTPSPARTVGLSVAAALLLHLLLGQLLLPLLTRIAGAPDLSAFAAIRGRPDLLAVMLLISLVSGAFGEEIVFRGFLQRRLEHHRAAGPARPMVPLLVTSLLFGAAHAYQGVTGMVGTAVAGLAFGAVMLLDRRVLWAAVLAHGLYDWSSFLLLYARGIPA